MDDAWIRTIAEVGVVSAPLVIIVKWLLHEFSLRLDRLVERCSKVEDLCKSIAIGAGPEEKLRVSDTQAKFIIRMGLQYDYDHSMMTLDHQFLGRTHTSASVEWACQRIQ